MNRFKKVPLLAVLTVLIATQAGWVRAGSGASGGLTCGWGFPNDRIGNTKNSPGAGALDVSLQMDTGPQIRSKTPPSTVVLGAGGEFGKLMATKAAEALCVAADSAPGYDCFAWTGPGLCDHGAGAPLCADYTLIPDVTKNVVCTFGGDSFRINHTAPAGVGETRFSVAACSTTNHIKKHEITRTDGGTINADLLATVLLRYEPDGAPGPVIFTAVGAPATGSPNPFTVNSVGKTDLEFHTAVCDGFGLIGVQAVLRSSTSNWRFVDSPPVPGYFVELFYPPGVTDIIANPTLAGPNLTMQMDDAAPTGPGAIPTLSEWGMGILIAILLGTGFWMLRRRQRLNPV